MEPAPVALVELGPARVLAVEVRVEVVPYDADRLARVRVGDALHERDEHVGCPAGHQLGDSTLEHIQGIVSDNVAGTAGGGYAINGGSTTLRWIVAERNEAGTDGGAMVLVDQADVTGECFRFRDNTAQDRGGGVAILSSGTNTDPQLDLAGQLTTQPCFPLLPNEYGGEFRDNASISGGGGGLFMADGTALLLNTAFLGNTSGLQGSAIGMNPHPTHGDPALDVYNVLLAGNGADPAVDVVRVQGGVFRGQHVTSADNVGVPFQFKIAAAGSILQRSIVWDTDLILIDPLLDINAFCTMFRAAPLGGGTTSGLGRAFGLDPLFVTTARGDYRLDQYSINAIDKCTLVITIDLDAQPRTFLYDRGAFEAP